MSHTVHSSRQDLLVHRLVMDLYAFLLVGECIIGTVDYARYMPSLIDATFQKFWLSFAVLWILFIFIILSINNFLNSRYVSGVPFPLLLCESAFSLRLAFFLVVLNMFGQVIFVRFLYTNVWENVGCTYDEFWVGIGKLGFRPQSFVLLFNSELRICSISTIFMVSN